MKRLDRTGWSLIVLAVILAVILIVVGGCRRTAKLIGRQLEDSVVDKAAEKVEDAAGRVVK